MGNSPSITGIKFTETSTTREFTLGQLEGDGEGNVFQYVQAAGAHTQYDLVSVSTAFTTTSAGSAQLATTTWTQVGFAQVAFASGEYGWVQRQGTFTARGAAAIASGAKIYGAATGQVDDAVAGSPIQGLVATAAIGGAGNIVLKSAGALMYA